MALYGSYFKKLELTLKTNLFFLNQKFFMEFYQLIFLEKREIKKYNIKSLLFLIYIEYSA